jgi:hypothetical protein
LERGAARARVSNKSGTRTTTKGEALSHQQHRQHAKSRDLQSQINRGTHKKKMNGDVSSVARRPE